MKQLKNYMEILVEAHTDQMLPKLEICRCKKCRTDIMSIALNRLKPHYVSTEAGALYAQMREFDAQHKTDVTTAIIAAIESVQMNPMH